MTKEARPDHCEWANLVLSWLYDLKIKLIENIHKNDPINS